jgi:hypothetical protein
VLEHRARKEPSDKKPHDTTLNEQEAKSDKRKGKLRKDKQLVRK